MKTTLYYFSGTGNSLRVTDELQAMLAEAEVKPILGCLNAKEIIIHPGVTGIIFPVHNFTLPSIVRQFIKEADFSNSEYIFAVATRGGSPCHIFIHLNRVLRKKKKRLDAAFYIDMPNNWLLLWDRPTDEEIKKLDERMIKEVERIRMIVKDRKKCLEYQHGHFYLEHMLFPVISWLNKATRYFWLDTAFYSDSKCNGCGICEKVCLSGKIKMENGKPGWQKEVSCLFCFACIHYCPQKAIQFKCTKTPVRDRYHHPQIPCSRISDQSAPTIFVD